MFTIDKKNALIFFFTQKDPAPGAQIDAHIAGELPPLTTALCRAMDVHPKCQALILSAAATYLREHQELIMQFKISAGI